MKAFYYENNGYNGVLLVSGERWISYDEVATYSAYEIQDVTDYENRNYCIFWN